MKVHWPLASSLQQRSERLLDASCTFEAIAEAITRSRVVCARWEWAVSPELRGRVRPSFELKVSAATYDVFFNSWDGYRARYYRSMDEGIAANRMLLQALASHLLRASKEWGLLLPAPGFPESWHQSAERELSRSLRETGAKVWISEHELAEMEPDWQSGHARHEILAERWLKNVSEAERLWQQDKFDEQPSLIAGTRAPIGEHLSVRGAFIVPCKSELPGAVSERKRLRAEQIHQYGFT